MTLSAKRTMTPLSFPDSQHPICAAVVKALQASEKKRMSLEQFVNAIQGKEEPKDAQTQSADRPQDESTEQASDPQMQISVEAEQRKGNDILLHVAIISFRR